jgi:hypothetical protein
MRVILKPAGLLFVIGVLVILSSVIYSRRKKEEIARMPETGVIAGFESKKKNAAGGAPKNALFQTRDAVKPVDLTAVGKLDWVHWGHPDNQSVNRKATARKWIGDMTLLQPGVGIRKEGERGPSRGVSWSDGAPTRKIDVVYSGLFVSETNGFRFDVAADATPRKLHVYTGGYQAGGTLKVKLSDGSKPIVTPTEAALASGYYARAYTIAFQAKSPAQKLTVEWAKTSGPGNVSLQAAALE